MTQYAEERGLEIGTNAPWPELERKAILALAQDEKGVAEFHGLKEGTFGKARRTLDEMAQLVPELVGTDEDRSILMLAFLTFRARTGREVISKEELAAERRYIRVERQRAHECKTYRSKLPTALLGSRKWYEYFLEGSDAHTTAEAPPTNRKRYTDKHHEESPSAKARPRRPAEQPQQPAPTPETVPTGTEESSPGAASSSKGAKGSPRGPRASPIGAKESPRGTNEGGKGLAPPSGGGGRASDPELGMDGPKTGDVRANREVSPEYCRDRPQDVNPHKTACWNWGVQGRTCHAGRLCPFKHAGYKRVLREQTTGNAQGQWTDGDWIKYNAERKGKPKPYYGTRQSPEQAVDTLRYGPKDRRRELPEGERHPEFGKNSH